VEDTTKDFLRRFITFTGETKRGRIGFIREDKDSSEKSKLNIPLIIDADGLKLLSKIDNWSQLLPKNSILTPHPGEMSVITGLTTQEIQDQRIEVAKRYAADWGQVIVLKGAFTIIASPEGNIGIVPVATSALARAGTGDVLAGLIVGLRAQGVDAFEAACAGAWIHAQAGLLAAKHLGNTASVIAGDVLGAVPEIITELQ
jgi:NAD(P)H-hydrate epimerase